MRGAVSTVDAQRIRRTSALLGSLSRPDMEALLARSSGRHRASERLLLASGEDLVIVLLGGVAKTRLEVASGGEYLRRFHEEGKTLGLSGVLGAVHDPGDVVAHTDVSYLHLPGSVLRELVNERAGIARACLRVLATDLAQAHNEDVLLSGTDTRERVVLRLIELAERWGRPGPSGIHVTLRLSQEELASWARTSRESVAKVLQQLRSSGIVLTGRRELIVADLPRLRERAARPPHDPTVRDLLRTIG